MNSKLESILILGYGYLGHHFKTYLNELHPEIKVYATNRSRGDIIFDIGVDETWSRLPEADGTLWTFPATPLDKVSAFYHSTKAKLGTIVSVGSTSALKPKISGSVVDESTMLDDRLDRVIGEKFLQSHGANIVRSAGIYGPDRNPKDWLKRGRIADFTRPINLIHIKDLCQFCFNAMSTDTRGQAFIACDAKTYTWNELIEKWNMKEDLPEEPSTSSTRSRKIVDAQKSRELLGVKLKHPTVLDGINGL